MIDVHKVVELPSVLDSCPTGSRIICSPPVMGTDEDWVLLVDNIYDFWDEVELLGFVHTSEEYEDHEEDPKFFQCWRKGEVNLIVTDKRDFFVRWVYATNKAKELNLLDKADRIALFTKVLYEDAQ